jgi:ComF family protein
MDRSAAQAKRRAAQALTQALAGGWEAALNFVFPPTCPVSDEPVDAPGRIAPESWGKLSFVTEPLCACCGAPFEFDLGPAATCAACLAKPPAFDAARAPLIYDAHSRSLVLQLKHAARTDALGTFAAWMAQAAGEAAREADFIVPIPLHPSRLRKRRFNQSALLAKALAKRAGRPFNPDALERVRATETQGGKSGRGRRRNVAGAFAVRTGHGTEVREARLLLVDDVYTTGATLGAAARALKSAGAARVDAVALARVARPQDVTQS